LPKVKEETITDTKIAEFYNTTTQTLRVWKKNKDISLNRRYEAFRKHYIDVKNG
jgi:hypothetical protein